MVQLEWLRINAATRFSHCFKTEESGGWTRVNTKRSPQSKTKGGFQVARRGIMSEDMKVELAKELGFYDVVQQEGWGGIKARDAGNMVKRAIELAEERMSDR